MAASSIAPSGLALRTAFAVGAWLVTTREGRPPAFMHGCAASLFRVRRHKAIIPLVTQEVRPENLLRPWSHCNCTLLAVVFGFMAFRAIDPDIARSINVARPDHADLARPAAGQPLQADHIGHDLRYGSSEKFCNIKLGYQLSAISYQPLKTALFCGVSG